MPRVHLDWSLLLVLFCLMGFSIALIWSINPGYLVPQIFFFFIGIIFYLLFSGTNSSFLKSIAKIIYPVSLVFLAITLVSYEVRGAARWIDLFGFRIQPSEIIKPFIIVSYAYFMSEFKIKKIIDYFKLFILFILPIAIIFLQPDLGNVVIFFIVLASMLFANNFSLKIILLLFLAATLLSPRLWHTLRDYQKQRIVTFINPQADPQGAGYNAIQAMIAVGSGGIFGHGLGRGTQSHLRFLPENHTDFIFASLTEELGITGALTLLVFYIIIFIKLIRIAAKTGEKFSYLLVIGIFVQLFSQVFINIAMNIGLVPITGVTLPFISSGGSSLIASFIALGIAGSLDKEHKDDPLVIK